MRVFAKRFDRPPPLLAMWDEFVVALDRAGPRLSGLYRTSGVGSGLLTALTSKKETFELAAEHGFPHPKTRFVHCAEVLPGIKWVHTFWAGTERIVPVVKRFVGPPRFSDSRGTK